MTTINTLSGDRNRGFQLGSNSGNVHVNFNNQGQPERSPTRTDPCSTVPFRRDPDFVDRDILAEISEKCSKPASHSRAALVGLGGVGKSQLAIEYSYRIEEQFPQTWIFWVHASNAARFEEGYRMIANMIKLPQRDEPTADILKLVSNWLRDKANGRWIMILDNADDPAVFLDPHKRGLESDSSDLAGGPVSLSTFIPQTPNGSILVTSRSEDAAFRLTGSHNDIVKVEPMDENSALLLFKKKLRGGFDNESDAIELLRNLDYMPLAVSQAAAYISQRAPRVTVAKYLNDLRKSDRNRANLLNRDAGDLRRDNKASNSIIATWQISFEHIRDERPSAARLLSLMSFFDRQGIPEYLLHSYDDRGDEKVIDEKDTSDIDMKDDSDTQFEADTSNRDPEDDVDTEFEEDVFTLTNYSLITTNVKGGQFEMHRLVQFSTRKWLERNNELENWKKRYIRIISNAFPNGDYENWTTCQVLFPHVEVVVAYRPAEMNFLYHWSNVVLRAGYYAVMKGDYLMAEKLNRQALEGYKQALGGEHPHTLASINNLGAVLQDQGKYEAAEEMFRQALDGTEKVLGGEHPNTLASINNLALVLHDQGKYEAAEETIRQALDGREKVLGGEHPDTLASINNLALVLHDQGKYEAAEELYRQALDGKEQILGREHPDTLKSIHNLALVLHGQGKYEAAEETIQQALDGREKVLGGEHPDTLASINNLAGVLHDQGKYEAAEKMYRQALDGAEKVLGGEHPDTLASINNLAGVLQGQGKYEAAEEMFRQALDGTEKVLGGEHPDTLNSVSWLAFILHRQRRYTDARALYERSCAGFQKVLGVNHRTTLACFKCYASMIEEMNASGDSGV